MRVLHCRQYFSGTLISQRTRAKKKETEKKIATLKKKKRERERRERREKERKKERKRTEKEPDFQSSDSLLDSPRRACLFFDLFLDDAPAPLPPRR
jgi:hypothetical protein